MIYLEIIDMSMIMLTDFELVSASGMHMSFQIFMSLYLLYIEHMQMV